MADNVTKLSFTKDASGNLVPMIGGKPLPQHENVFGPPMWDGSRERMYLFKDVAVFINTRHSVIEDWVVEEGQLPPTNTVYTVRLEPNMGEKHPRVAIDYDSLKAFAFAPNSPNQFDARKIAIEGHNVTLELPKDAQIARIDPRVGGFGFRLGDPKMPIVTFPVTGFDVLLPQDGKSINLTTIFNEAYVAKGGISEDMRRLMQNGKDDMISQLKVHQYLAQNGVHVGTGAEVGVGLAEAAAREGAKLWQASQEITGNGAPSKPEGAGRKL